MIKEKKIDKRIKQLQNAILNAVAAFDRIQESDRVDKQSLNKNIVSRLAVLVTEYRLILAEKTKILS